MVDVQLIKDTIKELLEANVDKDTIFSTLKDIGVEEGEITKYYTKLTTKDNTIETIKKKTNLDIINPESKKKETKSDSIFYQKGLKEPVVDKIIEDSNKIKESVSKDKHQEDLLKTAQEVNIINNTPEKERKKISSIDSTNNIMDNNTTIQLKNLQEEIIEVKAQLKGLTKIMTDILEENRNILNKL